MVCNDAYYLMTTYIYKNSYRNICIKFLNFLALAEGFQSGLGKESSNDPNDVTYVDDSALSGFGGDYEYEYSDYDGGFHSGVSNCTWKIGTF